jgi:PAS domain-containing protein
MAMIYDDDGYRRILDNLHGGIHLVDQNRVIQYWNKAAEKSTGYSAAVVVVRKSCADNILTHVNSSGEGLCNSLLYKSKGSGRNYLTIT